ncbi:deoxyuridine 5'-triphosphate nucleotidohydrolase [Exiguobacterium phage vB_EalM-132]|nr:deoxyuridine 5'-triphosphate nucleotidohydrolase [Exiguobacterium phage vB_EalM-132]
MSRLNHVDLPYYSVMPGFMLDYHHEDDAGLDLPIWDEKLTNGELSETGEFILGVGESVMLKTGIHLAIPKGHYGLLDSRSSTSKLRLDLLCRTIDSSYRGDIRVAFTNHNTVPVTIKNGEELFQIIIKQYSTAEPIPLNSLEAFLGFAGNTERGEEGFGSKERKNA